MRSRRLFRQNDGVPAGSVGVPTTSARSEQVQRRQGSGPQPAQGLAPVAAECPPRRDDPAEVVARVSAAKCAVLLRVHRY